jgi:hypothetical protein
LTDLTIAGSWLRALSITVSPWERILSIDGTP